MRLSEMVAQLVLPVKHLAAVGLRAAVGVRPVLPHVAAPFTGTAEGAWAAIGTRQKALTGWLGN
jgi:hypothetical protein